MGNTSTVGPDYQKRLQRVMSQEMISGNGIDCVLLFDPVDIRYLSGMREGIQCLLLTADSMTAVTTCMFSGEVREMAPHCELLVSSPSPRFRANIYGFMVGELGRRGASSVAIDASRTAVQAFDEMQFASRELDIVFHPVRDLMAYPRSIKDEYEIELTKRCVDVAESAFRRLVELGAGFVIGKSERLLSWEIEGFMRELGAERQGFPGTGMIVASGPNSAGVHPVPGGRIIQEGEPLLIDWGAEIGGYRSDSTRVLFPGKVPDWVMSAYPAVLESLQMAVREIRAGGPLSAVDLKAREVIMEAGFPEFTYGVGHGVGLQIHESPWIRPESTSCFEEGMITTVEPGIYIPGKGGIRIENIYRVGSDGAERLGELSAGLSEMVL